MKPAPTPRPAPPDPLRFNASGLDLELVRALFEKLAKTTLGARAVRQLAPRADDDMRAALGRVAEALALAKRNEQPSFAGVVDLEPAASALQRFHRPLERGELAGLYGFLEAAKRMVEWFRDHEQEAPLSCALTVGFPELARLRGELEQSVDEKGEIRDDATPRLGRLRRDARELADRIAEIVARAAAQPELRPHLTDFKVHRRGGRHVLALKARAPIRVPGVVHERSQSGETLFVEPREAVEQSNRLVEIEQAARAEEARVLVELTRHFLEHLEAVQEASRRIAEWELAVVGAAFCREYGARVPELPHWSSDKLRERGLVLLDARHPLLVEQHKQGQLAEVVPIDVRLGADFDLLVITGPNTGGKTLALKTVGIAVQCVRLGLPVCCGEGSRVPPFDGLVVDIGDEQEISQSLSTFASHLERIKAGLALATPRTLFLLDELGGGTDPAEGAALGEALLEHLLRRGSPTMATTHLGKLKEFCFAHERAENASVEFDSHTLQPRFRLLIGTPGESNALAIAERRGLDRGIVARARERLERRDREAVELMQKLRGASEHAEKVRRAAETRLQEIEQTGSKIAEREQAIERRGELLEAEAQRGLEERIRDAKRSLERAHKLLDQLPAERATALRAVLLETEEALSRASLTERRTAFLAALDKGQLVFVPRYRQRCIVKKVDRARREVTVKLGGMNLAVPFDEVTWYESL